MTACLLGAAGVLGSVLAFGVVRWSIAWEGPDLTRVLGPCSDGGFLWNLRCFLGSPTERTGIRMGDRMEGDRAARGWR